jgi:peptidoglycan/LPS O-acetylase OafA/YrhL
MGVDRVDGPAGSFPAAPLLVEERPPLVPAMLGVSPTARRMENLDALRVLAMFVIVVTHVTQPYLDHWSDERPYGGLYQGLFSINVAGRFGVPCFLMVSFFIYWHQLYDKGRSWGELLVRRMKRLLPAFVCWSLFYFALHKVLEARKLNVDPGPLGHDHLNWKDPGVWRRVFVLGQAHEHLYYLPVVMCALLLIPLLRVLWRRAGVAWAWIVGTLAMWTFFFYGGAFAAPEWGVGRAAWRVLEAWRVGLVIPLLIFPLLGMMSAGQRAWRGWIAHSPTGFWVGMLVVGLVMHVAETLVVLNRGTGPESWGLALAGLKVGRFVSAVPIFVLFLRHALMRDPLPRVSHHAFGLHFMHPAVIIGLTIVEGKLFGGGVVGWEVGVVPILVVNLVLTLGITFGLCLLVGRVKRLEFLVV